MTLAVTVNRGSGFSVIVKGNEILEDRPDGTLNEIIQGFVADKKPYKNGTLVSLESGFKTKTFAVQDGDTFDRIPVFKERKFYACKRDKYWPESGSEEKLYALDVFFEARKNQLKFKRGDWISPAINLIDDKKDDYMTVSVAAIAPYEDGKPAGTGWEKTRIYSNGIVKFVDFHQRLTTMTEQSIEKYDSCGCTTCEEYFKSKK